MSEEKIDMKFHIEDDGPIRKKISIEVAVEEVVRELDAAYEELSKTAKISGFRPGKIPRNVLRAKFGGRTMGDATSKLVEKSITAVLKENRIIPVSKPDFTITQVGEATALKYHATFEVRPDLDIKGYRDLGLKKSAVTVDDEDIEGTLMRLAHERAEFRGVERPAEEGDMCLLDFEGTIDGKPFKNGTAKDYPVILGDTILPGFSEALIGRSAGDETEIDTSFPADYHEKTLAGKAARFKTKVKAIRERRVPPLDDDFAKGFGMKTIAELNKRVREDIQQGKERQMLDKLKEDAILKIIDENPFEVPKAMVDRYFEGVMKQVEKMSAESNNPLVKEKNRSDAMKARYREIAEQHARRDMILDHIAVRENIEVDNKDIEEFASKVAKQTGEAADRVVARLQRDGSMQGVLAALRDEKVYDFLLGSAVDEADSTTPPAQNEERTGG